MSATAVMAGGPVMPGAQQGTMETVLKQPPGMDEQAFRDLWARTARPLRAYLARVTGNRALADDLLQETYCRFLQSGFSSRDEAYQRNYLFRIATNLINDHFRRPRREVAEIPEIAIEAGFSEEFHQRADVGGALAELGIRDRTLLWLAYVEGSSHAEIATVLGLRSASVRSMLFRARGRLAEALRARGLDRAGASREVR
jgi:RNA polymerase sigma-70 factor (ECF subfamily)